MKEGEKLSIFNTISFIILFYFIQNLQILILKSYWILYGEKKDITIFICSKTIELLIVQANICPNKNGFDFNDCFWKFLTF